MDRHKRRYGLRRRRNGWGFFRPGFHQRFLCGFRHAWLVVCQYAGQKSDDQGKYQQESKEAFMDFYFRLKQLPSKTKKGPCIQSISDGCRGLCDNLYDQHNAVIFRRTQKSPSSLTDQDQQTGASNFVNIDFSELRHIFLSTWHSTAYLIQNAANQRFKSPLLPYQSILHLCLPTKESELKKPGNG